MNTQKAYEAADIMITPDLKKYGYHKLRHGKEKERLGEEAARRVLDKLKNDLLRGGAEYVRNAR